MIDPLRTETIQMTRRRTKLLEMEQKDDRPVNNIQYTPIWFTNYLKSIEEEKRQQE